MVPLCGLKQRLLSLSIITSSLCLCELGQREDSAFLPNEAHFQATEIHYVPPLRSFPYTTSFSFHSSSHLGVTDAHTYEESADITLSYHDN